MQFVVSTLGREALIVRKFTFAFLCGILSLPVSASAANSYCIGAINNVEVFSSGLLAINVPWHTPESIGLCNVNSTWKGITPSVCEKWHQEAMHALLNGSIIRIMYGTVLDCQTLPDLDGTPAPAYFQIANK